MHISTPVSETPAVHRGRRVSHAEFLRLWNEPSLTTADIGRMLNITGSNVCKRARSRGLPPRGSMARVLIHDTDTFREMWAAGVLIEEMGRHFGVPGRTIKRTRVRLGLPPRQRGNFGRSITLQQFLHDRLARQMARTALQEQVMMLDAGCIARSTELRSFLKDRREVRI